MQKKACVVYTDDFKEEVPAVVKGLEEEGFGVCISVADRDEAEAAEAGIIENVNEAVKDCISNAEICVFLIPRSMPECITGAAKCAGVSGGEIVAVVEDIKSIPQIFDELATSIVCAGSPQLPEALGGKEVWEAAKQSSEGRKIPRIKCQ